MKTFRYGKDIHMDRFECLNYNRIEPITEMPDSEARDNAYISLFNSIISKSGPLLGEDERMALMRQISNEKGLQCESRAWRLLFLASPADQVLRNAALEVLADGKNPYADYQREYACSYIRTEYGDEMPEILKRYEFDPNPGVIVQLAIYLQASNRNKAAAMLIGLVATPYRKFDHEFWEYLEQIFFHEGTVKDLSLFSDVVARAKFACEEAEWLKSVVLAGLDRRARLVKVFTNKNKSQEAIAKKLISFDLDDTLICLQEDVPKEDNKVPKIFRYFFKEPLRLGSIKLMKDLISRGWEIGIYTTSYRSVGYIKSLFRFYGIKIAKVINQQIHEEEVVRGRKIPLPSKLPARFRIDLHVDDQDYLVSDGAQYGFEVFVVKPNDLNWAEKVLIRADQISMRMLYRST